MWLKTVAIKNFRTIENLHIELDQRANVIVGPNAIGKTTVLEAVRLAKATLAPRTLDEAQNVFTSLGAISPHNPTRLKISSLASDPTQTLQITATFELLDEELKGLDALVPQLAPSMVRAELGPAAVAQGPLALVQHLSTPAGQAALAKANQHVMSSLPAIKAAKTIVLDLTIDPTNGNIQGSKLLDQVIFSAFETRLPAHQALVSYFPADRAMPTGDANIQIGGPDIAAQLQSHNSQPQTKFNRLKPTILNNFLLSETNRQKMGDNFSKIFTKVLKNKSLAGINIDEFGLVSISIKENAKNRTFDIDGLSSGEKGLILTFLLISHSLANGGIVMIDEPELHLNPAVCKLILPFLIDEYRYVRRQSDIEAYFPSQRAAWCRLGANDKDGRRKLVIDRQQVRLGILVHSGADTFDLRDCIGDYVGIDRSKSPVCLDVAVVARGNIADEPIGPNQAAEPEPIDRARRDMVRFVDDKTRKGTPFFEQPLQAREKFFISEVSASVFDNLPRSTKRCFVNDGLERTGCPHPHVRRIGNALLLQLE